ncbi:MAG: histidine phosphatase family protein [Bdellovibrionales bacterium]|nr:histidine phosphatase family protein [Bdellovibrionales bacterium]
MTTLILLRHGDRDQGFGDVSLSTQGEAQAQQLATESLLQNVNVIISSPKARAQQTVAPLAEKLQIPVEIDSQLDQRKSIESAAEFEDRVKAVIHEIPQRYPHQTVLVASHSDWLQLAVFTLKTTHPNPAMFCFFGCAEFLKLTKIEGDESGRWEIHE